MQDAHITVRFEPSVKEKVAAMARDERRTVSSQTAYLLEKGLLVLEQQQTQTETRRDVSNG
jgi:hypothetical protein